VAPHRALSETVPDFTQFLRFFRNKIQPDGTLEDRASPELARIRRDIEKQRREIQQSLRGYLRKLAEGGAVQDELITIRGERFVIPVKIEQKRRVQGVVHGASSSGQTVFVEPLETIEQNNELVRLLDEELAEIHRILLAMTRHIGEQAGAILASVEVLAELELQFAKARFAEDYNCVAVQLSGIQQDPCGDSRPRLPALSEAEGSASAARLLLHHARHPLLERNLKLKGVAVVPITVELEGDHGQLVITGPNTGGKTVTLKTVGLLALMAQSGIPVPADRAEMPVFDAVSRRYRRLPIDRAEPFDLLRARHQHRFHFTHGHRAIARPARRTGLRHRSRGRRGARGRDRRILRPNRMHDRHLPLTTLP